MTRFLAPLIFVASTAWATAQPLTGTFASIDGGTLSIEDWRGHPVLVVNTASRCAFTRQYDDLQALQDTYAEAGLVVLAVPSNDFRQELGSDAEVKDFCEVNFGLTLPMTTITSVRGPEAHPFYVQLRDATGFEPAWNFDKVLLGRPRPSLSKRSNPSSPIDTIRRIAARQRHRLILALFACWKHGRLNGGCPMTLDFPTSFDLPTREEALYRAWRLRRLIAVATAIPFVIFALLGLVGLNGVAGSTFGLIFLTIIFVAMIGAHAIIFPNAHEETLTISLLLAAFGLIMAIIPGFFLAFVLWIALAIWALMWGQAKLTDLQMATEPHQPVMKGRIKVRAKPEAVRAWYPLRPESERGLHKCGAPDQDGVFPVWYDSRMPDIFETDHRSETPAQPEAADQAAPRRASGVSEHDAEDPVHAISRVLRDEVVQHDAPRFDMSHPSFWARIEADEPASSRVTATARSMSNRSSSTGSRRSVTRSSSPRPTRPLPIRAA